jgi:hypothetical protein
VFPLHDSDFYLASDHLGAMRTAATVAVVGVLGFPALVATASTRWRAARARAREALLAEVGADARVLRPGKTVVHGEVLSDDGAPCVSVRIRQSGREYKLKDGMHHKWTEVDRAVETRPFTLRLASGETVRVEPDQDVLLVDWLGTEARPYMSERTRVAELRPHARVYVEGELIPPNRADAYRGGATTFTLRPRRGARMIVSVAPLEERHQAHARTESSWAAGFAAMFLLVHLVFFGSFWRAALFGKVEMGRVVNLHAWTTTSKHGAIHHCGVVASFEDTDAPSHIDEISAAACREAQRLGVAGEKAEIPFLVVPGSGARWVGSSPSITVLAFAVAWGALFLGPLLYGLWLRHTAPWYERTKIVDEGKGPLGSADQLV